MRVTGVANNFPYLHFGEYEVISAVQYSCHVEKYTNRLLGCSTLDISCQSPDGVLIILFKPLLTKIHLSVY